VRPVVSRIGRKSTTKCNWFDKDNWKVARSCRIYLSQNYFETLLPCIGLLQKLGIMIVDVNMLEVLPPVYWKPEEINRL
jgi:hypothetical protein